MSWRHQFILARLKCFDRNEIVRLLTDEHRPSSLNWWRARWWRGLMLGLSACDIFTLIYAKNLWGIDETSSGAGSTLAETANLRQALPDILNQLDVSSMLDIPCGDLNWMSRVELEHILYLGADIVPDLVAQTSSRYSGKNRKFLCLNLITDPLPKADAVFCRDCLVHLPYHDALKALSNIRASGATYLLTTTFPSLAHNNDISLGHWRPLNLERPPFNLPPPIILLHEGNPDQNYADKSLGIWRTTDIPEGGGR